MVNPSSGNDIGSRLHRGYKFLVKTTLRCTPCRPVAALAGTIWEIVGGRGATSAPTSFNDEPPSPPSLPSRHGKILLICLRCIDMHRCTHDALKDDAEPTRRTYVRTHARPIKMSKHVVSERQKQNLAATADR